MEATSLFLFIFLFLFAFHFILERGLAILHIRHILAHRHTLPDFLKSAISPEQYEKSIRYAEARHRFGQKQAFLDTALVLICLFSGLIPWWSGYVHPFGFGNVGTGILFLGGFAFANSLLSIPFEWYEIFHIEAAFGFNQTTPRTFWIDKLKGWLLGLILGIPLLTGLLWLMERLGPTWWIWGASLVIGFQFILLVIYPILIAPLFNKFTPLEDGEMKHQLMALADKCQFHTKDIFVMDGSRRSTHSNAYFTGLGKGRRIVLYDTLLQQLSVPELKAVLAHEIGHYKKGHILKMILLSSGLTFLGFFLLSRAMNWPPLFQAFELSHLTTAMQLLLLGLIAPVFTFWVSPLIHRLSRNHEYEADAFAAITTQDAQSMKGALIKLFEKNLSPLFPHPAYSAYHHSHPTLLERLSRLSDSRARP